jgi:hypothetical protein
MILCLVVCLKGARLELSNGQPKARKIGHTARSTIRLKGQSCRVPSASFIARLYRDMSRAFRAKREPSCQRTASVVPQRSLRQSGAPLSEGRSAAQRATTQHPASHKILSSPLNSKSTTKPHIQKHIQHTLHFRTIKNTKSRPKVSGSRTLRK